MSEAVKDGRALAVLGLSGRSAVDFWSPVYRVDSFACCSDSSRTLVAPIPPNCHSDNSEWPRFAAMPDRHSHRIVVVDDNYDANASLSRLLEASGYQVAGW